jgi:hypothetical protein
MPQIRNGPRPVTGSRSNNYESPRSVPDGLVRLNDFAIPDALRTARFVPRQAPGRREPARVTTGAFRAAGLAVPDDPRQINAYQLSQRQGWPWSAAIDEHVRRRGAELLGGDRFLCVDLDQQLAVDGSVWVDGLRWLTDAGTAAGELLDITACVAVRTPGNPDRSHGPGWHLWFRSDPDRPVRTGAVKQCRVAEIKTRCTAPGSPGYIVRHAPADLPVLPAWIARLAGSPRARPEPVTAGASAGRAVPRFRGAVARLLEAEPGERHVLAYWAARVAGETRIDPAAAEAVLVEAARRIGLVSDEGEPSVRATIRDGVAAGSVR